MMLIMLPRLAAFKRRSRRVSCGSMGGLSVRPGGAGCVVGTQGDLAVPVQGRKVCLLLWTNLKLVERIITLPIDVKLDYLPT